MATPATEAPADTPIDSTTALETLIRSLEDPQERAELLDKLRRLQDPSAEEPAKSRPEPLSETVMDEVVEELRQRTDALVDLGADVFRSTEQLPALAAWVVEQVTDQNQRALWLVVATCLFFILAVGLVARNRVLRWRPALESEHLYRSLASRFTVEIAAALAFGILTLGMLLLSNTLTAAYDVDLAVVASAARSLGVLLFAAMVWRAIVRLLFGEAKVDGHLLLISDRTAQICREGLLAIGRIGLVGFGILYACFLIGLPESVYVFLVHLLYLVVAVIAIVLVLRLRVTVQKAILGWSDKTTAPWERFVPARFLARTWHYFVILLISLHYFVWALKIPGGIVFLSRATFLSVTVLVLARLAIVGINLLLQSDVPAAAETEDSPPLTQERVNRYAAPARLLLRSAVILLSVIAVAAVWNPQVIDLLASDTGKKLLATAGRLALIAVITVIAFEVTRLLAHRFIDDTTKNGTPRHSNRARTLAGIVANGLYFIFGVAGLFTALSQIGVETAPLLAGAGVVGLAIGFGSQALVKDLINGLFMLLGDIMRIGDVVDIAGKAGVVESMSMRTITLRSYDGSVHVIPYGFVDVVTNLTKEFSFAVLDIDIAYREKTDDVIRVIREIDDRMRKEWPYRRLILEPIDIAGVDQFADSAVVIRMRSKTRAGEQWGIRREFLRRIKLKFDELGIEIPFPHQTVYWGRDKTGQAPPLRIETLGKELRAAAEEEATAPPAEAAAEPHHEPSKPLGEATHAPQVHPAAAAQGRARSS